MLTNYLEVKNDSDCFAWRYNMNGVLNTGLEFWQIIVGMATVVFSVLVVKIAISFDLNKFLERKDKNNLQKLKNACPHFSITVLESKKFEVRSLFYKPLGMQHVCRQCGLATVLDFEQHERQANYYVKNPSELIKDQKQLTKLAKKSGKI